MRGEKLSPVCQLRPQGGSPPRARGKASHPAHNGDNLGITPACAGKRIAVRLTRKSWGDHPRVRGEKANVKPGSKESWGSPPRARGKESTGSFASWSSGITPACAGKSQYFVTVANNG